MVSTVASQLLRENSKPAVEVFAVNVDELKVAWPAESGSAVRHSMIVEYQAISRLELELDTKPGFETECDELA